MMDCIDVKAHAGSDGKTHKNRGYGISLHTSESKSIVTSHMLWCQSSCWPITPLSDLQGCASCKFGNILEMTQPSLLSGDHLAFASVSGQFGLKGNLFLEALGRPKG